MAEFLAAATDESNWEDDEVEDDDEENMLLRHGDQQSGFIVSGLPANAPPPKAFVAANMRESDVSELQWQWATWKRQYDEVCHGLQRRLNNADRPAIWSPWERLLRSICRSVRCLTWPYVAVFLPGQEEDYLNGNEWLEDELFLDTSPRFIALARDMERVFEADEPAEDFLEVLARIKRAVANRRID